MSTKPVVSGSFMQTRRQLLLLPLALLASRVLADTPTLPAGMCPLNSGGPSLLGTKWRLFSIYGNQVPKELKITLNVGDTTLMGSAGCNQYTAYFRRVGHTGFMMERIERGSEGCPVLRPEPGAPTINVGDWEGNYIRTLQRAGSVEQEADGLHFYNRSGEQSVVFVQSYDDPETTGVTEEPTPFEVEQPTES
ncbi:META domain-containing protein [Candidatus Thiothrix anitrata]|uniref:META domain-containing protein n=1 Tax=Candidatus Thiothrix anitrata TaxID=2823902 RepID=A0ABX7X076_9GAMM|nr:META domain-containing protein [Candidatus Thiothrix anitrata]QTR49071.1 META domain-containing protein [Candidatus Thiothrix anitrata]